MQNQIWEVKLQRQRNNVTLQENIKENEFRYITNFYHLCLGWHHFKDK